MSYTVAAISDKRGYAAADALLLKSGLRRDALADYICGVFDDDFTLCATGSSYQNTLRCLAVDDAHRGEGLMNLVIGHLCEMQAARGCTRLFLYTKPASAVFFRELGFYEIARTADVAFLENRKNGFADWLKTLPTASTPKDRTACVVMNANPFTKGHRFLLENACAAADAVHVFVLSERFGPIAPEIRKKLVTLGTADLPKVILHDSGPYIISSATFPSYFLKQEQQVSRVHAALDAAVFVRIAQAMNIGIRFAGEEPFSQVTALYNAVMADTLPKAGIAFRTVPRLELNGRAVSASDVRQAIHDGNMGAAHALLPETSWRFLTSPEGRDTVNAIQRETQLIHH